MKKLKRLIISVACVFALAIAGVIGYFPNKTDKVFANADTATVVETGAEINAAIKELNVQTGNSIKNIIFATNEEFSSSYVGAQHKKELICADAKIYLYVVSNDLYYHGEDDEPFNGKISIPEDSTRLFSGLSTVESINLSGISFFMDKPNTEGMFEGCSSLKEVTFGFFSTFFFGELQSVWRDEIYEKESGDVFEGKFELEETDTITLTNSLVEEVAKNIYFDLRNGSGFVAPTTSGFSYNPTSAKYSFYGWSTELDGSDIVNRAKGSDILNYDIEDFEDGNYYAVWKNNGKTVVTKGFNLDSISNCDKLATHGYSWNGTEFVMNGLTLDVIEPVAVEEIKSCIYSSNKFSINVTANSENEIVSSVAGVSAIYGKGGITSIGNTEGVAKLSIATSTGIVSNSVRDIMTIYGVELDLTCTTGYAFDIDGELQISGPRYQWPTHIVATSDAEIVVSAKGVGIVGENTIFEVEAPEGYAIYSVDGGLSVSYGAIVKLNSGSSAPCVYIENGGFSVTYSAYFEAETSSIAAIVMENSEIYVLENKVIKTGETKAAATFADEYNNEKYLLIKYHSFTYSVSADGKSYIATCENEDCCLDDNKIAVTLTVSSKVYDGQPISYELVNRDEFLKIARMDCHSGGCEIFDGTNFVSHSGTPTNAGKYKILFYYGVSLTDPDIVYAEFEIFKADSSISTVPTIKENLVFNGAAQALINAGTGVGGILCYKLEGGEYGIDIPTMTNAGEYKVYYKVVGDANHNDTVESFVTVVISSKEVEIDWCEDAFTYNGNIQTITATYKDISNQDVSLNISVNKEFKNVGEYIATASFKNGETNYKLPADVEEEYNILKLVITKPQEDTTNFVYSGSEITYTLATNNFYTISGNTKTNAGNYEVVVSLIDTENIEWNDSTTADLTFDFVISKADAEFVNLATAKTLVFNGSAQTLINSAQTNHGTINYKLATGEYSTDLPSATDASSYVVYYKIIGDANHNDSEESTLNITIAQKEVEINWCANNFTYNGTTQSVTATYKDVEDEDIALNIALTGEFKNAGEYTATASFKNSETNYKLPDVVTKTYNISKIKVTKPAADETVFVYTGEALTYELTESEYYMVSNNTKTEVGKYNVSVVLKDKTNTEWSDSTSADLTFEFVINKVEFDAAEDGEGNPVTDVKIESIVGGVDPEAKLVVETINVSNAAEKERLGDVLNLENNKEIAAAIDIKLMLGYAEVQPNGKVVLNIKVPEVVKNKTFELFHVHGSGTSTTSSKLTYNAAQNGFISVEVEDFSEFVFVTEKVVAPATAPATEDSVNWPWIFMGLLGGFAILFLIWFFILKRQKYDIFSKIVISIFETIAVVFLCKFRGTDAMTYIIVDLVAFVCVDIIYMINTSKETKKETSKQAVENINA